MKLTRERKKKKTGDFLLNTTYERSDRYYFIWPFQYQTTNNWPSHDISKQIFHEWNTSTGIWWLTRKSYNTSCVLLTHHSLTSCLPLTGKGYIKELRRNTSNIDTDDKWQAEGLWVTVKINAIANFTFYKKSTNEIINSLNTKTHASSETLIHVRSDELEPYATLTKDCVNANAKYDILLRTNKYYLYLLLHKINPKCQCHNLLNFCRINTHAGEKLVKEKTKKKRKKVKMDWTLRYKASVRYKGTNSKKEPNRYIFKIYNK